MKDLEKFSEERLKYLSTTSSIKNGATAQESATLARIALSVKQAKPVACKFGKNNGDGTYTPTYDYWPLPSYIKPHKDWPVTLFYDAPQPTHTEQVIPDGWKLVPIEPTEAMLDEFDSIIDFGANDSVDAWRRLIAAAPKPEAE